MDAVEFIKTRARMGREYDDCHDCILCDFCEQDYGEQDRYQVAEQVVANVLKWAKEHPVKTRQSEFLKQWPDTEMIQGVINIHPCLLDSKEFIEDGRCREKHESCEKCKRDFWLKEIK